MGDKKKFSEKNGDEEEEEREVGHCLAPIIQSEESLLWKVSPGGSDPQARSRGRRSVATAAWCCC